MSYVVVHENISDGLKTITDYGSKEYFDECMEHPGMQAWYEIVAQGVTYEEAERICSSPSNHAAMQGSDLRKLGRLLSDIDQELVEVAEVIVGR